MNVWGQDKVNELSSYNAGEMLNVSVNIESREFNGRWYTDVRAWRIQRDAVEGAPVPSATDPFMNIQTEDDGGDLPF